MPAYKPIRASFTSGMTAQPLPPDAPEGTEVYYSDSPHAPTCYAVGFTGKAQRPAFNFRFHDAAQRSAYVTKWLKDITEAAAYRHARRAAVKAGQAQGHPFQVGDILYWSWGYEQTNAEFFQVVAVTRSTVTLRAIASVMQEHAPSAMAAYTQAKPDAFLADAEPFVKRPRYVCNDHWAIPMEYGHCSKWSGRPVYCSWYA